MAHNVVGLQHERLQSSQGCELLLNLKCRGFFKSIFQQKIQQGSYCAPLESYCHEEGEVATCSPDLAGLIKGFPKIRGSFWGAPIFRIILFGGLYGGPGKLPYGLLSPARSPHSFVVYQTIQSFKASKGSMCALRSPSPTQAASNS